MIWITNGSKVPFCARESFTLDSRKKIKKAIARICGLGQFIFYVNGEKISDHELDPGWTDYRKAVEYVEFDVTRQLCSGQNVMAAEVGNGWYIMDNDHYTFTFPSFMPPNPNPYRPFGDYLILTGELTAEYTDGTAVTSAFGGGSRVAPSSVTHSNVYGSETCDHRVQAEDWIKTSFDDSAWEKAQIAAPGQVPDFDLTKQFQPPVKVIGTYIGRKTGKVNGREIYDFGLNMSGLLDVRLKAPRGAKIFFYPAEKLTPEGDVDQVAKNWVTVDTVITCITGSAEEEHFRQKFTYFAGRYIAVELPEGAEITCMKADAVTSAWERDGSFRCDNEKYNKIYDMIERTVEANMVSVHTDCPTIERFAWQEPNHLMAPSIMFMKNGRRLWEKFLWDMRNQQHTSSDIFHDFEGNAFPAGDGLMPSQCPCYIPNVLPVPGMGSFYDIIPWGSTCILGTMWHYRFYGDRKIIKDNYDAGKRYYDYERSRLTEDGFLNHGLGDWGNPDGELSRENIETAFLYADAETLMKFASALGRTEDAERFRREAEEIKKNYNERLLFRGEDGWAYRSYEHKDRDVMTLGCEALPLYFGMVPADKEEDVVKAFRRCLIRTGSLAAGEISLPYIIQTAARYGMNDIIACYITKEEHPSYYAFILAGETTLGEYWEDNPRSHCHDMMGHIIEWYYRSIAGISDLAPGFAKVSIHPWMPEDMNEFTASYNSIRGKITVHGKRINGKPVYDIQVPETIELVQKRI